MSSINISTGIRNLLSIPELKNKIIDLEKLIPFSDEPRLHLYYCSFLPESKNSSAEPENSYGASSLSKSVALIKCLNECIEQLCLFADYKKIKIFNSKYKDLSINALNPSLFDNDSSLTNKQFGWIEGKNFGLEKKCYIPAQLVYFEYKKSFDGAKIPQPKLITGTAAHFNRETALLHAIYEIVERDSFLTTYFNKITLPEIDLYKIENKTIKSILYKSNRYNLELRSFDTTTDIKIPSFLTLLIDRTRKGPTITCGVKAGLRGKDALLGSIEEALLSRFVNRKGLSGIRYLPDIKVTEIKTLIDSSIFWSKYYSIKHLDFILNQKPKIKDISNFDGPEIEELDAVRQIFKENKKEVFYADISQPEFKNIGLYVYKVVIPSLQPLYRDINNPFLRKKRIEEIAVFFGKKNNSLNKIPHPFM